MVSLRRIAEEAIRKTRNDDILYLSDEDVLTAITERMKSLDFPHFTESYFPEFLESDQERFEKYMKRAEYFQPVHGNAPWNEKSKKDYENTKSDLRKFLDSLEPGDKLYDDMLDVFTDAYLHRGAADYYERPERSKLQLYLDNKEHPNETWLEVGCGFSGLHLLNELNHNPDAHKVRFIFNDIKPEAVHAIRRYAEKLEMNNVATIQGDASSPDFVKNVRELLGHDSVSQIRANQVLRYITKGKEQFFDNCDELLKPNGSLHLKEGLRIVELPLSNETFEKIRSRGASMVRQPDGTPTIIHYSPSDAAKRLGYIYKEKTEKEGNTLHHYSTLKKEI